MAKEATSRLKINKLLEESGWILVDTPDSKSNVVVEPKARASEGAPAKSPTTVTS